MEITPIIWTSRKTTSGLYPIKIRVTRTVNRNTKLKYFLIGYKIPKDAWDPEAKRVNPKKHPDAAKINLAISTQLLKFEKQKVNGDEMVVNGDKESFSWWCEEYLSAVKKKNSAAHYKNEKNACRLLHDFTGDIKVKEFNLNLLTKFEAHLKENGYHKNTIYDTFERLRRPIKLMINDGMMEYHKNPFNAYKIKRIPTNKERLTKEEIDHFMNMKLSGAAKKGRDWFLIAFFCGGARSGDMIRWRKFNFIKCLPSSLFYEQKTADRTWKGFNIPRFLSLRLKYTTKKTAYNQDLFIPRKAALLLEEYNYAFPWKIQIPEEMRKVFSSNPIVDKKIKEDLTEKKAGSARSTYRVNLKKALAKSGLKYCSPHSVRHALADYAAEQGLTIPEIQGQLTHNKATTTMIYMKSINKKITDAGSNKLWGKAS